MRIINGVEHGRQVETLVELEELIELTPEGFRPMEMQTLDAIAARLRTDEQEHRMSLFEAAPGERQAA